MLVVLWSLVAITGVIVWTGMLLLLMARRRDRHAMQEGCARRAAERQAQHDAFWRDYYATHYPLAALDAATERQQRQEVRKAA